MRFMPYSLIFSTSFSATASMSCSLRTFIVSMQMVMPPLPAFMA